MAKRKSSQKTLPEILEILGLDEKQRTTIMRVVRVYCKHGCPVRRKALKAKEG